MSLLLKYKYLKDELPMLTPKKYLKFTTNVVNISVVYKYIFKNYFR